MLFLQHLRTILTGFGVLFNQTRCRFLFSKTETMISAPQPIYIGVDPAFRENGFWAAIIDRRAGTLDFRGFKDVLEWHDWLRSEAPLVAFVLVENSNLENVTFKAGSNGRNKSVAMRFSRNVGTNQAVSELAYVSAIRKYGSRFAHEISPSQKGKKITNGAIFEGLIRQERLQIIDPGFDNNAGNAQDKRDAAKLALILEQRIKQAGLLEIKQVPAGYNPAFL